DRGLLASRRTGDRMVDASPSVQTPDETLVGRARERDAGAREELFQRYREDAYRVAYRLLGHEQDALDVVQEALIKAFLGLGDFDGRSGFRYWLLRIVGNTALDWGRRRKRRSILSIGNGRSELPGPALASARSAPDAGQGPRPPRPQDPDNLRSVRRAGIELQGDRCNGSHPDRHGHEPDQRRA